MTVCLIIPPSPFLLDERVFMSLGVLKVASSLEAANVVVSVLDLSGFSNEAEIAKRAATSLDVGMVPVRCYGITATTPQFPAACRIARAIREVSPNARLILGGPHATLCHAAIQRGSIRVAQAWNAILSLFDCVVCGDGEIAIFEAIKEGAPKIIDADGRHSKFFLSDATFESHPWPARHLVDIESYHYKIDGHPALSLIAQLGCPFACGFCAGRHSPMLRHIRKRSSQDVVDEMVYINERWGHTGFMFYDDELNVNPNVIELMNKIADVSHETWHLRGFIKAELFTDEQADAMRRAGVRTLLVGYESGSERILANINKRATQMDNTRSLRIARKHSIAVKALMSLGHPGESEDTIRETTDWLRSERPDDFDATIITPYPGSPYYDLAVPSNRSNSELVVEYEYKSRNGDKLYMRDIDYSTEADYYKGAPGSYVSHVWTDSLQPMELVRAREVLEASVRSDLNIPFNPSANAVNYEHSMGQTLPASILRRSELALCP